MSDRVAFIAEMPDEALPRWPAPNLDLSRRLEPGSEYPARTAKDRPISWDVDLAVTQGWGDPIPEFPRGFATRLKQADGLRDLRWNAGPGGGLGEKDVEGAWSDYLPLGNEAVRAVFRVDAATVDQAVERAERAGRAATDGTLDALGVEQRTDMSRWSVDARAFPTGSELARANIRL